MNSKPDDIVTSGWLAPWMPVLVILFVGVPFVAAGVSIIVSGDGLGWLFFAIGSALAISAFVLPVPYYAELRGNMLYLSRYFTKGTISVDQISDVQPMWPGNAGVWLKFKSETRFGTRVLVMLPLKEAYFAGPSASALDGVLPKRIQAAMKEAVNG